MKTFFRDILTDIRDGRNIDVYVAALLNIVLAVLALIKIVSFEILGAAILVSISWLTLNALAARKQSKLRDEEIIRLIQERKSAARASDFFVENYVNNSKDFQKAFLAASELSVIGMGQNRMIIAYGGQIQRILSNGGNV